MFCILTWSDPSRLTYEHTSAFLSRFSEKCINKLWGKHGCLIIPAGYIILGDKGFANTSGMYLNFNTVLLPAFLLGNSQFTKEKVCHNLHVCQLWYSCETVYSRITNCQTLYGFIKHTFFYQLQDECDWAHGRANLYLPLQMPAKFGEYFLVVEQHQANCKQKRSLDG